MYKSFIVFITSFGEYKSKVISFDSQCVFVFSTHLESDKFTCKKNTFEHAQSAFPIPLKYRSLLLPM